MHGKISRFKNSFISLDQLEQFAEPNISYEQFSTEILALEEEGILIPGKSTTRNLKVPSLAYKYRINKALLKKDVYQDIETKRFKLHKLLILDEYFHLPPEVWENDYPYIEKINTYIETNGLPNNEVPAP